MKGFWAFTFACCVVIIAFAIWWPATHESKAEKIQRLEQQVNDLELRVSRLEKK